LKMCARLPSFSRDERLGQARPPSRTAGRTNPADHRNRLMLKMIGKGRNQAGTSGRASSATCRRRRREELRHDRVHRVVDLAPIQPVQHDRNCAGLGNAFAQHGLDYRPVPRPAM
jgi:hypothetical protein